MTDKQRYRIINTGSVLSLIAGIIIAFILKAQQPDWLSLCLKICALVGKVWIVSLLAFVLPLIGAYMLYGVLSLSSGKSLGKFGVYGLKVHVTIVLVSLVLGLLTGYALIDLLAGSLPYMVNGENSAGTITQNDRPSDVLEQALSFVGSLQGIFGKLVVWMLILSLLAAIVVRRFLKSSSEVIARVAEKTARKSMRLMQNMLITMPLAVFALIIPLVVDAGISAMGAAGIYIIIASAILLMFILLMYLVVHVWGHVGIKEFAKASISPQLVAASSRSSLASIPALVQSTKDHFNLEESTAAVVIPFFVSVFHIHRVISSPFKYLFLMTVFQVDYSIWLFAVFLSVQVLTSFISPGIPGGAGLNIPVYIATGVPMDGYFLLRAFDAIPDVFMTVANITEVMMVTSVTMAREGLNNLASIVGDSES